MNTFMQNLAYGARMLKRAPGFTIAAVLTLALGIGVNTATFGIVSVLSLLPYASPPGHREHLALLGIDALSGRALTRDDGRPRCARRRRLELRTMGAPVRTRRVNPRPDNALDGRPHTVVGIMPPRFEFPVFNFKGDAWTTIKTSADRSATRTRRPPSSPSPA